MGRWHVIRWEQEPNLAYTMDPAVYAINQTRVLSQHNKEMRWNITEKKNIKAYIIKIAFLSNTNNVRK